MDPTAKVVTAGLGASLLILASMGRTGKMWAWGSLPRATATAVPAGSTGTTTRPTLIPGASGMGAMGGRPAATPPRNVSVGDAAVGPGVLVLQRVNAVGWCRDGQMIMEGGHGGIAPRKYATMHG